MKGFSITRGSNIFSIRSDIFWPKDFVNSYLCRYKLISSKKEKKKKSGAITIYKYIHIHIRDVLRTHSNILDGTYCQNKSTSLSQLL